MMVSKDFWFFQQDKLQSLVKSEWNRNGRGTTLFSVPQTAQLVIEDDVLYSTNGDWIIICRTNEPASIEHEVISYDYMLDVGDVDPGGIVIGNSLGLTLDILSNYMTTTPDSHYSGVLQSPYFRDALLETPAAIRARRKSYITLIFDALGGALRVQYDNFEGLCHLYGEYTNCIITVNMSYLSKAVDILGMFPWIEINIPKRKGEILVLRGLSEAGDVMAACGIIVASDKQ